MPNPPPKTERMPTKRMPQPGITNTSTTSARTRQLREHKHVIPGSLSNWGKLAPLWAPPSWALRHHRSRPIHGEGRGGGGAADAVGGLLHAQAPGGRSVYRSSYPSLPQCSPNGCGSKPMVPFWGRCTTHLRLCGDGDALWGTGFSPMVK